MRNCRFLCDIKEISHLFDFLTLPKDHFLYSDVNKLVIGVFKLETLHIPIREFVGLRSKMYSFNFSVDEQKMIDTNKLKGVKKSVVKKEITFDDYYRCLMSEKKEHIQQHSKFNVIRLIKHNIYSIEVDKIGLCSHDDKRFLLL